MKSNCRNRFNDFPFRAWRLSLFFLISFALVATNSCESDIDLIYETKGKPVAYCILNPTDSVQYLRISRSFIVRGNPYIQNLHPDSLLLDEDFYAYLERIKPDGIRELCYFEKSDLNRRDSGLFPRDGLVLFQTSCKVMGGLEYGLYIHFPGLPKLVAGSVSVVNPVQVLDPDPLPGREITLLDDQGYLLRWTRSIKFAVYQPAIRIIYWEGDRNFRVQKELTLPQALFYGDSDNLVLSRYINGAAFINDLAASLTAPESGMKRKIIGFDMLVTTGGPELAIYTRSGQNSIASFAGLDEYSNLDGAAGVFSSITYTGTYNNRFSDLTINCLASDERTRHLGFLRFNEDF